MSLMREAAEAGVARIVRPKMRIRNLENMPIVFSRFVTREAAGLAFYALGADSPVVCAFLQANAVPIADGAGKTGRIRGILDIAEGKPISG